MLVNIATKELVSPSGFRALFPNTSFPEVLTDALVEPFGFAVLHHRDQPILPVEQTIAYTGVVFDGGRWVQSFKVVARPAEELAEMLRQNTLNAISELEAQITPRRVREALVSGDNTFLTNIENQIASLRVSL